MEALHSRVVPGAKHTLDDLVFAAFQGPVLSLSSRVLHRHKVFSALLLLRTHWRADRHLSQADVSTALLRARCCVPDTLAAVHCSSCGDVLSVSRNPEEQERLRGLIPSGIELYAVTVRTRCTSSRKHVGSAMLVLAAQLVPGVPIVSDRFAIYARHAARHMFSVDEADTQQLVPAQGHSPGSSPGSQLEECFVLGPHAALSPMGAQLSRPLGPQGGVVGVVVNAVTGLTEEECQLVATGVVPVLRANVPGYLVHKTSIHASVVIVVLVLASHSDVALVDYYAQRYLSNQTRNPLNRNLIVDGLVEQLLLRTNTD
eukprot:m51a1_g1379 hypothetical protein (315) ;mRNA; f:446930-447940